MTFLGIDLGTSGLRALLIDEAGKPIGSAECSYEISQPKRGWSEQNPHLWIDALEKAVAELRSSFPAFLDLKGIGVAGHMHGAILLNEAGEVLRPCVLWNDTRSHAEAASFDSLPQFRELSGNIVFPGFTAPKLEWIRKHEPEIYSQTAKVLLPAAFLNFYLAGDYVADMSDGAGTSWLHLNDRDWSSELLSLSNMREDQMPRLVEGCQAAGTLREVLRSKWGLRHPVIVAGGAGDNAAAACGVGALSEGQGFVSLGTSGVILVARDICSPSPERAVHTFCHALPDRWYQMGVMLSATDSLNWLSGVVGKSPAELTEALGDELHLPGDVTFLPYLSGERTPHNDVDIRGGFWGLSKQTSQRDLTRAVLEGVAYGLRDSFEALISSGVRMESLFAIGGGSRSTYWVKLVSTVFGIPIHLPEQGEFGAALGAARLGLVAATGANPQHVLSRPEIRATVQPDLAMKPAFDASYQTFRNSYPAIKSIG